MQDRSHRWVTIGSVVMVFGLVAIIYILLTPREPPPNPTQLSAECLSGEVVLSWDEVKPNDRVKQYAVYVSDSEYTSVESMTPRTVVPGSDTSTNIKDLANGKTYYFAVTSVDRSEREHNEVTAISATPLLPLPLNLRVEAFSGMVAISWDRVQTTAPVEGYSIYMAESAYVNVEGMTPRVTTGAAQTSTKLAGIENGTTYHFAVTAIDPLGGERKSVETYAATPSPDTTGPIISDFTFDEIAMVEEATVSQRGMIGFIAADPVGVSRVEVRLGNNQLATDSGAGNRYSAMLDPNQVPDGSQTLIVTAYDTLNNETQIERPVHVQITPPAAPSITSPTDGLRINRQSTVISGTAERSTEVVILHNGKDLARPLKVDDEGMFSTAVALVDGENHFQAAARNRGGLSQLSEAVLATLDRSIPETPRGLIARARSGGVVQLSWNPAQDGVTVSYELHRSDTPLLKPTAATKINKEQIENTRFEDLIAEDGTYYYRLMGVNATGTRGEPSTQVKAAIDGTPPRALTIEYRPDGNQEAAETLGPGRVDVVVTVSEPLREIPFFSLNSPGHSPIAIALRRVDDSTYVGTFDITESTPSGEAYAMFSARDRHGNQGTDVDSGSRVEIDTNGPLVTQITVTPGSPVRNERQAPATLDVVLELDELIKSDRPPELSFRLSGRDVAVDSLTRREPRVWYGRITLPAEAGQESVEVLRFAYRGMDELGNVSTDTLERAHVEIYQGDLPALSAPSGITAAPRPGGYVQLAWKQVEGAADYQIFRQAPGEDELTEHAISSGQLEYSEKTPTDGVYRYAIASVRRANQQTAVSRLSDPAQVHSDSVAPQAPRDLTLKLTGSGIRAEWKAPSAEETLTYALFRSSGRQIESLDDLLPIQTDIAQLLTTDSSPSEDEHAYAVVAVDQAGNRSVPSESGYLNVDLLPVKTLTVEQEDHGHPIISWTHGGSTIAGYDIFHVGSGGTLIKLNQELMEELKFADHSYTGSDRHYAVVAVDKNGVASIPRLVFLPSVRAELAPNVTFERGVINRLEHQITNQSSVRVENIRLRGRFRDVELVKDEFTSNSFSLDPGESRLISLVVPADRSLSDDITWATTLDVMPTSGETVHISRANNMQMGDNSLVLDLLTKQITRGATGSVRFTLENTSDVELDIVIAQGDEGSTSDGILFKLLDQDDNVIATQAFKQDSADLNVSLVDGHVVARIPSGATFKSEPVDLFVPMAAPTDVRLQLEVPRVYYHLGQHDAVSIEGPSTRRSIRLTDTPYFGEITYVAPKRSLGNEAITIAGRAVEHDGNRPVPMVPLQLVIRNGGFERKIEVFSATDGTFAYAFKPLRGGSGEYKISCLHPDVTDRPDHGEFVIGHIQIEPARFDLPAPKNHTQELSVKVTADQWIVDTNLQLAYLAEEQPAGSLPKGIDVSLPVPTMISAGESKTLTVAVQGDNTASSTGTLVLTLHSVDTNIGPLGKLPIGYRLSDGKPSLVANPQFVETGVKQGERTAETITLENAGFADLNGLRAMLVDLKGRPAPEWVFLDSQLNLGSLVVGEARKIQLFANPPASVAENTYEFELQISASNHSSVSVPVYVTVTQSGEGHVLFKVEDIYTQTLDDETSQCIPGLAGARIEVQRERGRRIEWDQTTDENGELLLSGLPAGRYRFRANAPDHQQVIGLFQVKAGITVIKNVFLDYDVVTVEWSVSETTIRDRYEITLHATYETNVPAPVVAIDPGIVNLPVMQPGDVYKGSFSVTNHGLVRADNLRASLPTQDEYVRYEFQRGIPNSLGAKDRLTVPYRAVCLRSLDPGADGEASGAGCRLYVASGDLTYTFDCANGLTSTGSTSIYWSCSTDDDNGAASFGVGSNGSAGSAGGGSIGIKCGGDAGAVAFVGRINSGSRRDRRAEREKDEWIIDCILEWIGDCITDVAGGDGPAGE